MRTKLFLIAVILVLACMFALISCNDDVDLLDDTQQEEDAEVPVNEYDTEDAQMSTEESRDKLEKKYKELQTLYNLAVDTVANTEGEVRDAVKELGTQIVDLINNKIANPDYAQFEDFIKDATKTIEDYTNQLISLVPSIAD